MSCPWIENRKQKEEEKTRKYGSLRWEVIQEAVPGLQDRPIQHHRLSGCA